MSSPLAIATVTHVMKDLLNDGLHNNDLSGGLGAGVIVSSLPPDRVDTLPATETSRLNLFMYMVTHNPGWRNEFLPHLNSKGDRVSNPPLALDLHYLLTAYGSHELHHEILLGYGMLLLHENPVLTREAIQKSLTPATSVTPGTLPAELQMLSTSGLAEQIELIKISPETLNTEEISRLWTAFSAKYRPFGAYVATVVLIESKKKSKSALPVRQANLKVIPFRKPSIEKISSKADSTPNTPIVENQKILPGYFLVLDGVNLSGEVVSVNFSGVEVTPPAADITDQRIMVQLPNTLKAGVQGVQVVHRLDLGTPVEPHQGFSSNVQAFVLNPKITAAPTFASNAVDLTVDPAIRPSQQVVLLLNQLNPTPPALPVTHSFLMPAMDFDATPTGNISIPVTGVLPGEEYLVRIQVDGAESHLETDATGAFISPKVTIP
ncbi:MAG: DUF4255 domain-containing protein [Bacteroidota bacterium]